MNADYFYSIVITDNESLTSYLNDEVLESKINNTIVGDTYKFTRMDIKLLPLASKSIDTNLINIELLSINSDIPLKIEIDTSVIESIDNLVLKNSNKIQTGIITFTSLDDTQITNIELIAIGEQ